jgi:hypothetical protein
MTFRDLESKFRIGGEVVPKSWLLLALRGLHQHTLDMFVALFGKRGAHHLVGGALFITAQPAVTDGFSDRRETGNISHF